MATVEPGLMEKIRKLIRLSTNKGASEAEAALAAEHVRRLLDKHNLSMIDVAQGDVQKVGISVETKDPGSDGISYTKNARWAQVISIYVGKLYDCESIIGHHGYIYFVGDRTDCEVASEVYVFIVKQMRQIMRMHPDGQTNRRSFLTVCTTRVAGRIREIVNQREAAARSAASTSTALVVRKGQEIARWKQARGVKVQKSKQRSYASRAFEAGYQAGGRVRIHKEVG